MRIGLPHLALGVAAPSVLAARQQVGLADALAGSHHLPLREDVHRIAVVDPFGAVQIALVNRVDADEARAILAAGGAAGQWG